MTFEQEFLRHLNDIELTHRAMESVINRTSALEQITRTADLQRMLLHNDPISDLANSLQSSSVAQIVDSIRRNTIDSHAIDQAALLAEQLRHDSIIERMKQTMASFDHSKFSSDTQRVIELLNRTSALDALDDLTNARLSAESISNAADQIFKSTSMQYDWYKMVAAYSEVIFEANDDSSAIDNVRQHLINFIQTAQAKGWSAYQFFRELCKRIDAIESDTERDLWRAAFKWLLITFIIMLAQGAKSLT